ncbi:unnamed protein product [Citrullus colocynthis]|uniref:Uncharacterized protein n=1 Tax=Citrullus colocynthis TaxID=252529 RepID=A0ABP0YGP4_9ROSI
MRVPIPYLNRPIPRNKTFFCFGCGWSEKGDGKTVEGERAMKGELPARGKNGRLRYIEGAKGEGDIRANAGPKPFA